MNGFIPRWQEIQRRIANPTESASFPDSLPRPWRQQDGMLAVLLYEIGQYHPRVTSHTEAWRPRKGDLHV